MRYAVGIDLGTTFTSAATGDDRGTHMVPLSRDFVVPSLAYHTPDGTLLTGLAAREAAVRNPSRLARGFKRRLGDPTPLMLGSAAYSPAALMAAQLQHTLEHVASMLGGPPESIALTCPAVWGPYRREQFAAVPELAHAGEVRLVTEPEAAATHYSRERALGEGEVVAVYDLGGSTVDTTVLRMRSGGMEILGTPDGVEHLGGMDFDDALLSFVDQRLDGAVTSLDAGDPAAAAAIAEIRAACIRAKIALSTEPDVTLQIPLPSGKRELLINRLEFNDIIRPSVELTVAALRRTVESTGLRADELSAVLLAGGSSRIPLVTQMVSREFGKPVRVSQHPKFTVALGAAAVARNALYHGKSKPASARQQAAESQGQQGSTQPPSAGRSRWPLLAGAAAVLAVIGLVVTVVLTSGGGSPSADEEPSVGTSLTGSATVQQRQAVAAKPLSIFGADGPMDKYRAYIASDDNWEGKEIIGRAASHQAITASVTDGLRVKWRGNGAAQVYLQTANDPRDLSAYADNGGALVFDVQANKPSTSAVKIAAHCVYPCGAELDASSVFSGLKAGDRKHVTIPVSCFTAKGLDPSKVNTPFLVYTEGPFDATFSNIKWVPRASTAPDATSCESLS